MNRNIRKALFILDVILALCSLGDYKYNGIVFLSALFLFIYLLLSVDSLNGGEK